MAGSDDKKNKDAGKQERDDILSRLNEIEGENDADAQEPVEEEIIRKPEGSPDQPEDLDSLLERIQETAPGEKAGPTESLNVFQRLIGVLLYPSRVFQYLKQKPDIWVPLVIAAIIAVFVAHNVMDIAMEEQFAKMEESGRQSAEEIAQARQMMESGPFRQIQLWVSPIIGTVMMYFLIPAVLLLVGTVVMGGKTTYKAMTSVFGYTWVVAYSLIGTLIGLPLMLQQQTLKIELSLAAFLPDSMTDSAVYNLINAFDVPTVLFLAILGIGLGVLYNWSTQKGILTVALTYLLVWVLPFRVLLGSFLSQFGM